ncbi:MAG TPA: DNA-formamidopyrimidine glycosylase family protein [Candidatus Manganitrophaceae bacterium]|nr:DNA-formamidopyrimidine glycosylase family protein [Candidatus Manganitrophaceae bacterium]
MPEIPDLDAIVSYLRTQIIGATIKDVSIPLEWMLRSASTDPEGILRGETIEALDRRGKHLIFSFRNSTLVVHAMLVGRFYYTPPEEKRPFETVIELILSTGKALRYADEKRMGRLYLVPGKDFSTIPGFNEQGPDPMAADFTFERFMAQLKGRYGEMKGLLTNAKVISGIGNAYVDEILFEAGIYPFRKKKDLSEEELRKVYEAIPAVLNRAKAIIAERMGSQTHLKIRDFLQVHGKGGDPCPKCGNRIATVGAWQRATNFCRNCQPGLMVEREKKSKKGKSSEA